MRLTAPSLSAAGGLRHGFFSRRGGVSRGIYASLNCGLGSGDDPAAVAENRRRAMVALGVGTVSLVTPFQRHGAAVVVIEHACAKGGERPVADGLVTRRPGLAIGVLTADCAPVLLADPRAGVVAAAHAGWRGALGGILERTLEAMAALGAAPRDIIAAVGPCIGRCSYEVGPEFPAPFLAENAANARFFTHLGTPAAQGRRTFDLPAYVAAKLAENGVACEGLGRDSCAESAHFFSYRRASLRNEKDYGRNLAAIALVDA